MSKSGFVTSITRQSEDFPGWYNDVVLKAQLADYSPVRGCMIIRPYGYAIWESMRDELDRHIKRTGHSNVYFPLFVPKSLLEKEAEHVEGFNPQVAWVTHAGGKELDEWLAIRPDESRRSSRTSVKDWIQSYRDLPLLMNLWNNVVRWELRTRLFLRTAEFLWQEAHTFHATEEEAADGGRHRSRGLPRGRRGLAGHPGHPGPQEPRARRSRGPSTRHAIEAMMRDTKALQAGTSHMLGQNFAQGRGHRVPRPRQPAARTPTGRRGASRRAWSARRSWPTATTRASCCRPTSRPTQLVIVPIFRTEERPGRRSRAPSSGSSGRWRTSRRRRGRCA